MDSEDKRDSRTIFQGRSSHYSAGRPTYPPEILDILRENAGVGYNTVIADIGSGTGLLSKIFLEKGNPVFCVEPNKDMRERATKDLSMYRSARIIDGSAEHTGLPDSSVDIITAGQSFHWFDLEHARKEFSRILRPGGRVCLVWNDRIDTSGAGINSTYEEIVSTFSTGYHKSGSGSLDSAKIEGFFSKGLKTYSVENSQYLDLEILIERYRSASYSFEPPDPRYKEAVARLGEAFKKFEKDGKVLMLYTTKIFLGTI